MRFEGQTTTFIYLDDELLPLIAGPQRLTQVRLADGSFVYVGQGDPPQVIADELWIDAGSHGAAGNFEY